MVEKTQIQLPRYFVNKAKNEAIETLTQYINDNLSDFIDGEEITLRYKNAKDGTISSVNAIVDITEGVASLSVEIGEKDTIKIVEKDGLEPIEDEESLWLSDNWDTEVASAYPASDLKTTVKDMVAEIRVLKEELAKCKEALTNTLGGGDIITNSYKYWLENEYKPEIPVDGVSPYTTGDTEIYKWDIYIADSPLTDFGEGGLYIEQRYYPYLRAWNSAGEEIEITTAITVDLSVGTGTATISFTGGTLYALTTGDTEFNATITDDEHSGYTSSKQYYIVFEKNEKPDYESQYNVKHLITKHADSLDILMNNSDYLAVNEFCWCIAENALYYKAQAANGTIQLFKINGGGSVTPTGSTITYTIDDDGTITAVAEDGTSVTIDEDGTIVLVGTIDNDGIINIDDTAIN